MMYYFVSKIYEVSIIMSVSSYSVNTVFIMISFLFRQIRIKDEENKIYFLLQN